MNIKHQLNAIILQARASGIEGFVFGFRHVDPKTGAPQYTTHFEKLPMNDAVNICGFGWLKAIDAELSNHPEYNAEFVKIFTDAKLEFLEVTKKINLKVVEFRKKK